MDDLTSMITQFLGNEENMKQLQSVVSSLGLGGEGGGEQAGPGPSGAPSTPAAESTSGGPALGGLDLSALSSMLGGGQEKQGASQESGAPALDIKTLLLLQKALSTFNSGDRNTELLRSLKPHFSEARAKKVDDAIRILQLIKLLPLIKDSGLFGSLIGGEKK